MEEEQLPVSLDDDPMTVEPCGWSDSEDTASDSESSSSAASDDDDETGAGSVNNASEAAPLPLH